jgi:integrase
MPLINRLTDLEIRNINRPCKLNDGDGLYLIVTRSKREGGGLFKRWAFRFRLNRHVSRNGKRADQWMTLGSMPPMTLKEARAKAAATRKQRDEGINPIIAKRAERAAKALQQGVTFQEYAEAYIADKKTEWKNQKYAADWTSTLSRFAYPVIGKLPPCEIDTHHVLRILKPIWKTKTVTAGQVRERIEKILDAAKVDGLRAGDNPARWKYHLQHAGLKSVRKRKVKHFNALPFEEIGGFMSDLRARQGVAPRALELLILCANRSGEVIGAKWHEFDLDKRVWVIPGERMKGGEQHKVPLSDAAARLLRAMETQRRDDFVFPGDGRATMSNSVFAMLLRRMGRRDITTHGFRSSFRDWSAQAGFDWVLCEKALAHAIGNKTSRAYLRDDMLEQRRPLMTSWAAHCAKEPAKVLSMVSPKKAVSSGVV